MNATFENINQGFLSLYKKEVHGLPEWRDILYAFDIAEKNPNHENIKYVNLMYHAIKDLFSPVYQFWIIYTDINELGKSVTITEHRLYNNSMGVKVMDPVTFFPDHFEQLYSGKSLESLNEKPTSHQQEKINQYRSKSDSSDSNNWYVNDYLDIKENIDLKIKVVKNDNILKCTFEDFITTIQDSVGIDNTKQSSGPGRSIETYFTEEGIGLIPFIKEQYQTERLTKPAKIGPLIAALQDYVIIDLTTKGDRRKFIAALTDEIGKFGTPQQVETVVKDISDEYKNVDLIKFKNKIKKFLSSEY